MPCTVFIFFVFFFFFQAEDGIRDGRVTGVQTCALPIFRLANESRYGLDASVWTRDLARGARVARRVQSGAVCVNDVLVNYAVTEVPMGGWKESGIGYRHGPGGIRKFCAQQSVVIDRFGLKSEINWWPMTAGKVKLFRRGLNFFGSGWRRKLLGA